MLTKSWLIIAAVALLAGCGGGDNPEYKNSALVDTWQTYSASPEGGMHFWGDNAYAQPYSVEKLPRINANFRSGFAFVSNGNLILHNLATREQFKLETDQSYTAQADRIYLNAYQTPSHFYTNDLQHVYACSKRTELCRVIEISEGTYPFVYAESHGKVLIVTNWGDAIVFNGFGWCRMARSEADVFKCSPLEPMVTQPRAIQLYSSVHYQGHTLLGEWPTGSVYEFDGETLAPSPTWTPPQFLSRQKLGYEAQTMAAYCDDLFVGYWPRGEIWRFDGHDQTWKYFTRLFTDPTPDQFIPYASREPDGLTSSFYGQRVTALVPFQDSLYATTSSLTVWTPDIKPSFMSAAQLDEYGSVYKIHKQGCHTEYPSPN